MRKHLILPVVISTVILFTSFSCNPPDAAGTGVTEGNGPVIEAQYTLEEVLDIAQDFSPECRKRIPPKEGSG